MPTERHPSLVHRLRQHCADWCWSLLTRDLHPRPYPARLQSFLGLLADLFWYARALFLPQKARCTVAGALPWESEAHR